MRRRRRWRRRWRWRRRRWRQWRRRGRRRRWRRWQRRRRRGWRGIGRRRRGRRRRGRCGRRRRGRRRAGGRWQGRRREGSRVADCLRIWYHVHLRDQQAKIRRRGGGIGYRGLQPFRRLPRLVHAFEGHPNRDGPDRRRGGVAGVRDAEVTSRAEAAAGGGQAVGAVRDGHRDLSELHPTPKKGSHSLLEGRRGWGVVLAHRDGKLSHVAGRATRAQRRCRRRLRRQRHTRWGRGRDKGWRRR